MFWVSYEEEKVWFSEFEFWYINDMGGLEEIIVFRENENVVLRVEC